VHRQVHLSGELSTKCQLTGLSAKRRYPGGSQFGIIVVAQDDCREVSCSAERVFFLRPDF